MIGVYRISYMKLNSFFSLVLNAHIVSKISHPILVKSLNDRLCRMILVIIIQSWYDPRCLEYPFLHSVHLQEVDYLLFHSAIFVNVKLFLFIGRKINFVQSITNNVQTNDQLSLLLTLNIFHTFF